MRKKVQDVSPLAVARFAARARRAAGLRGNVNILITTSAEMRGLNQRFRRHDKPTDVLSFPANDENSLGQRRGAALAGDIALSAEIAAINARRYGHSVLDEIKILMLHGILHLAGYDHESDQGQMARREQRLRRELLLPASLIDRALMGDRKMRPQTSAQRRSPRQERRP
jgi:probable rRNA maturation factor